MIFLTLVKVLFEDISLSADGGMYSDLNITKGSTCSLRLGARERKSGHIILKVVNAAHEPAGKRIDLPGAGTLSGSGHAAVLASESPVDEKRLGRTDRGFSNG